MSNAADSIKEDSQYRPPKIQSSASRQRTRSCENTFPLFPVPIYRGSVYSICGELMSLFSFLIRSTYNHCVVLSLNCELQKMYPVQSTEWIREGSDTLTKGSTKSTPAKTAARCKKHNRPFSLAHSPQLTEATKVSSTQLNCFRTFQNSDLANPFFESDYPSQRFRPQACEEEDPADPYYSPPPTFIPPESPNELKVEDQTALAILPSETQVRGSDI